MLPPKAVLPRARVKQIGGVVIFLRENKILATPLENIDQSTFIARLNNISRGGGEGGGGAPYRAAMIVIKFGKMQVGKTATLETYNFRKVQFWK